MVQENAVVTLACSSLSLLGSIFVLCSYVVARTKSRPKAAQLIRNLALTDFAWFTSAVIVSSFWIAGKDVPAGLCFLISPIVIFTRMASLIWTCAISFDVLMSVTKRKWLWNSEEMGWKRFRYYYYGAILLLACPGAILNLAKQIRLNSGFGCSAGYESLGEWYEVFLTEILPILIGFIFNVFVYFRVRHRMTMKAYPQSVRKRRRQIMYHYIIVCILCWSPTIIFYALEVNGVYWALLELIARITLYLTGFFNFLVFGMQDPHLKRSADLLCHIISGLICGISTSETLQQTSITANLKSNDVVKSVMFEEATIVRNADTSKDKRSIYRNKRLSREEKEQLYLERPDLQPLDNDSPNKDSKSPEKNNNTTNNNNNSNNSTNNNVNESSSGHTASQIPITFTDSNNLESQNDNNNNNKKGLKKRIAFDESNDNNNNNNNTVSSPIQPSSSSSSTTSATITNSLVGNIRNALNYFSPDSENDSEINEPLLVPSSSTSHGNSSDNRIVSSNSNSNNNMYNNKSNDFDVESNHSNHSNNNNANNTSLNSSINNYFNSFRGDHGNSESDSSSEDEHDEEDAELYEPVENVVASFQGTSPRR